MTNRKTRKAMESINRKEGNGPAVMTPISGEDEEKSLECLRYQQHMSTIGNFQNQYITNQRKRQELINQLMAIDNEMGDTERQVATFAAEAKDQVRTLMMRYGFTQAQINRLAPVPEILKQVNITSVLDMAGPAEEDPPPAADVTVGGEVALQELADKAEAAAAEADAEAKAETDEAADKIRGAAGEAETKAEEAVA
jgi:hypothetical protein